MKKFILILSGLALAFVCLFVFGCNDDFGLSEYVSELKQDVYIGDNDHYELTASYGYKENPLARDGKVGNRVYALVFRLVGEETSSIEFCIELNIDGQTKNATFSIDPVSNKMTAFILADQKFNQKEFDVTLKSAGQNVKIKMKSLVPSNALDNKSALKKLHENNKSLVDTYMENGVFNGEIIQRIIVKDGKPYWYIGLADKNGSLKALLIDGVTGQTLAIRHVF